MSVCVCVCVLRVCVSDCVFCECVCVSVCVCVNVSTHEILLSVSFVQQMLQLFLIVNATLLIQRQEELVESIHGLK